MFHTDPSNCSSIMMNSTRLHTVWLQDAGLLHDKKKLLDEARQVVHEKGYEYKKKTSRSHVFGAKCQMPEKKRHILTKEMKEKRYTEIQEDKEAVVSHIDLLERQKQKFINS